MNSTKSMSQNVIQKILLRFVFLYVILYIYPYGFEYIKEITTSDFSFWKTITIKFGEVFLGWEFNQNRFSNGFDSKYDFSRFLLIGFISIIGALIWVFIDSRIDKHYNDKLKILLQTILRYHIGLTLILYGLSKVFMLQFGEMDIDRLETKIGDNNGMSLLWTFMSNSKFYVIAAGLIEVIGGVLLLFRKTTSLGAFLLLIAMTNVVLMDIGYDVSVKMFAIHLLIMILLLMRDDLERLYYFFLGSRPTMAKSFRPLFKGRKVKKMGFILKGLLLIYIMISFSDSMMERMEKQHSRKYQNLTSSHEVELFVRNGDTIAIDTTNGARWTRININGLSYLPETLLISKIDNTKERYTFDADTLAKKLSLTKLYEDNQKPYELFYESVDENTFVYKGIFKGDTLWMRTKAKFIKDYTLTKRGVRWIRDLK